jgi:hypothetical protein
MLGVVLAMPALAASGTATTTTLTAGTLSGCTQPLSLTVTASGSAATGIVTIQDEFNGDTVQLGSVALSSKGVASPEFSLATGSHVLTANYVGNSTYASSASSSVAVSVTSTCNFMPTVSNITPATTPVNTLTAGESGAATVSIIPLPSYTSSLSGTVTITLSCSGLPDAATCTFTPATVQITSGQTAAVTSSMVIQTVASSSSALSPANRKGRGSSPIAWAFLLPGFLGLGGLAWGTRRRNAKGQPRGTITRWLNRFSLVTLVGLVTLMGTTACNPRYDYYNHGPSSATATPSGNYTLKVTGQSSDGVTATIRSTTFAFTVN